MPNPSFPMLVDIDLNGLSLLNPRLNPLAAAPANAKPYYLYTSTASADKGTIYVNVGTYESPVWQGIGAVASVNGKIGVVVLTQDDVGDGATYKRTHNDLTDALVNAISGALPKSGGTMTGAIAMGGSKITGLADGTADQDAVTLAQMGEAIATSTGYFRGSFATKAALLAVAWQTSDPTAAYYVSNNDYAIVEDDETQNDECWRYVYVAGTGWAAQYKINEAPLTAAQIAALNSGANTTNIGKISTNETNIGYLFAAIADTETGATAEAAHAVGDYFFLSGVLYKATAAIAIGDAITPNTNCEAVDVAGELKLKAPLASPAFTGTPTAPTPGASDDSTKLATTAFVKAALSGLVKTATGTIGTSATSATVNYSGTLINAYATMGGALVMLDIAPGSGSVVFSTAEAPSAAVTCVVVYV